MTSALGRNYARALFELAAPDRRDSAVLADAEQDVRAAREALFDAPEVRAFLSNRLIGRAAKKALIRGAFQGKVDERVLITLYLLVDRGRTSLLGEICEEFERLCRLARGVRKVAVLSAFPLGGEETRRLRAALEKRLDAMVEMTVEVRPSLIGGVVAMSEGREVEFSIEARLRDLAGRLAGLPASAAGNERGDDRAHQS